MTDESPLEFQPINSCEDFLRFLAELRHDLETNHADWQNLTLDAYLESMSRYLESMNESRDDDIDEGWRSAWISLGAVPPPYVPLDVNWHFIARLLAAPKSYE